MSSGFLPFLSLQGPRKRARIVGNIISILDFIDRTGPICCCTRRFNSCVSFELLILELCRILHSSASSPFIYLHSWYSIKSVITLSVDRNKVDRWNLYLLQVFFKWTIRKKMYAHLDGKIQIWVEHCTMIVDKLVDEKDKK